jgi:N-acetylmuramoyl-L-alanine amidase
MIKIVSIKENLIPVGTSRAVPSKDGGKKNIVVRMGKIIKPTSLTIHSTANPKSYAIEERNWLVNPNNKSDASWNIAVDEREAVIAIPLNEKSNHSGSSKGNDTSIGLEICESGDREKTLLNAIEVSVYIMKQNGITALKQHYDWNGKNCPRILRDTGRWAWFEQEVQTKLKGEIKMFNDGQEKEALKYLVTKGIITDEAYWLHTLECVKNQNWLFIKFANEIAKNN